MQGDFSVLSFDPREHRRGVSPPRNGVLRNVSGVLHQQGRVMRDADLTEGELLELAWNGQAGRDIIGAGVAAVPATAPGAFKIEAAFVVGSDVHVTVGPGHVWADGILTRLASGAANPASPVERLATYFGPPIANPAPAPSSINDGVRDAVILEVSEEALHGFQYPDRLIEPALGGPDTAGRSYVNCRFRLLRLGADEDCHTIAAKLADDPGSMAALTVSLAPPVAIGGDCPVVGGGGYTGFEHYLYRIEIADTTGPARFKWSQWNGGLAGRGRFDATVTPAKVFIDAGRAAIVNSGLVEFYLEALQYDELAGTWVVVYGATATLNSDHDLELATPAVFGTLPSTTDSVFFRLWNGIAEIVAFTNAATPQELRDGIRLVFDAPAAGNYRPGDYWTFSVRAGEITNPAVLIDHAPPIGVVYHRVPLAEINWTARHDTRIDGTIEDCRDRFRPLTNQKICCTLLVGDGVTSFGDFNALEEAAAHLPAAGGELCLLPGLHRANLLLDGRRNISIHGCPRRTLVLPRTATKASPIITIIDSVHVEIRGLDLLTYDGTPVVVEGRQEGSCRDVHIVGTRMIGRVNVIRATNAAELTIAYNRLHLLDTVAGRATISLAADDTAVERNTLVMMPFVDDTPGEQSPDDDPSRDPADPCATTEVLYANPKFVYLYVEKVWSFALALLAPKQPYRAIGGIHVRAGSERVRILENVIVGGGGNGVTLGGDLDPVEAPPVRTRLTRATLADVAAPGATPAPEPVAVTVNESGQFLAVVADEAGKPVPDVDIYLEGATAAADRTDTQGMASIKAAPGPYTLDVAPAYRVVRVTEAREDGVLVNAVTLAARTGAIDVRGFMHEITIEANDISAMGLSGIGFALRAGASVKAPAPNIPTNDPRAAVLAYIDAAVQTLGLVPLLRAADPLRDLVIIGNRIHHNLRNPFDDAMRASAQLIGQGGVSLAVVESAVVSANYIYENGPRATDPVCGVFVGYGDDLEITDNVLAANGTITTDFEQNRQAGLRGGFYIRFAGALSQSSTSSGRKPALRLHDNRVDQPAGRAVTIFAFGPVSCANNHLNSEYTGRFQFLDTAVGGVLIFNLGGIHRMLMRTGRFIRGASSSAAASELSLPGGETMLDDNYVRLGPVNRSLVSQLVIALDDLGYSANQAAVFRGDPFFANAALVADAVRATAARFREDATHTISLLTMAFRMNNTSLNQADHCILAFPNRPPANQLPTLSLNNQVLDFGFCDKQFSTPIGIFQFFSQVLAASANDLGGTLPPTAFTPADVELNSRLYLSRSLNIVGENEVVRTKAYQLETVRLSQKIGADHPRTVALKTQAEAGTQVMRIVVNSAETATTRAPAPTETTAAVSGRVVNAKGQGQPGLVVELVTAKGERADVVAPTDAAGFFGTTYDEERTATLARAGKLFLRVLSSGKEVFRATDAITVQPGADVQQTITLPVRVVTRSTVANGTVIFGSGGGTGTPPVTQPPTTRPPVPPPTTPPSDTTPPTTAPPPTAPPTAPPTTTPSPTAPPTPAPPTTAPPTTAPKVRTPLDRLDIDAKIRDRLIAAGINDVEAVLQTEPAKLAEIVGDRTLADKIREMAGQVLGIKPVAGETGLRPQTTPTTSTKPKQTPGGRKKKT
jgi:hypothetical protein